MPAALTGEPCSRCSIIGSGALSPGAGRRPAGAAGPRPRPRSAPARRPDRVPRPAAGARPRRFRAGRWRRRCANPAVLGGGAETAAAGPAGSRTAAPSPARSRRLSTTSSIVNGTSGSTTDWTACSVTEAISASSSRALSSRGGHIRRVEARARDDLLNLAEHRRCGSLARGAPVPGRPARRYPRAARAGSARHGGTSIPTARRRYRPHRRTARYRRKPNACRPG